MATRKSAPKSRRGTETISRVASPPALLEPALVFPVEGLELDPVEVAIQLDRCNDPTLRVWERAQAATWLADKKQVCEVSFLVPDPIKNRTAKPLDAQGNPKNLPAGGKGPRTLKYVPGGPVPAAIPEGIPANLEAERDLLGALARDLARIPEVRAVLEPEDLYLDAHGVLFREMVDLQSKGVPIDGPHLLEALIRAGRHEGSGSVDPAVILASGVNSSPVDLARIVKAKAFRREFLHSSRELAEMAASDRYTDEELAERLQFRSVALSQVEAVSGWERPDLENQTPAVPFPLEVLPPDLVELVKESAECLPCPLDYVAVPMLAVASTAIGRSVAIRIKDSWTESPNIFAPIVGPPGQAKSPALRIATRPLWEIHNELLEDHHVLVDQLRQAKAKAKAKGAPAEVEPEWPRLRRIVVDNSTCEALAERLSHNPRGLIMISDELSGWLNGMNQYKGGAGNDRQFYLSLWNGAPIIADRKGQDGGVPIFVPNPFLSITGAMTPDKLEALPERSGGKTQDEGFMDRLLPSYPDPVPFEWTWSSVSETGQTLWTDAIRRLWERESPTDSYGRSRPYFVTLTEPARKAWEAWIQRHTEETRQSDFPRSLVGPWSKFRTQAARLVLILDQLDWSATPSKTNRPRDISARAVERAVLLVEYFKAHFRRVLESIQGGTSENRDGRDLLDWALGRGVPRFSEREVADNFRKRFKNRPDDFATAINWLLDRHAIRRLPDVRKTTGRPPRPTYEIHPSVFKSSRNGAQNAQNS